MCDDVNTPKKYDLESFVDSLPKESQKRLLEILKSKKIHDSGLKLEDSITTHKNYINLDEDNEHQPISGIVDDEVSPILGDATITRICHFKPEVVKLNDAVKFIVKEISAREWGNISIYTSYDGKRHGGCIATFEYRNGVITKQNSTLSKDTKVKLFRTNGGWGSMDYELYIA